VKWDIVIYSYGLLMLCLLSLSFEAESRWSFGSLDVWDYLRWFQWKTDVSELYVPLRVYDICFVSSVTDVYLATFLCTFFVNCVVHKFPSHVFFLLRLYLACHCCITMTCTNNIVMFLSAMNWSHLNVNNSWPYAFIRHWPISIANLIECVIECLKILSSCLWFEWA
jgi:hypothetical protein